MDIEEIKKIIEEKGEYWIIAAMVEGSIGYHSPQGARFIIEDFKNGKTANYCERCMSCFDGNLVDMISYDINHFKLLEKYDPFKVQRIIKYVEKISKVDTFGQLASGLMYPTMNI